MKMKAPKSGLGSFPKRKKMTESKHSDLEEFFLRFPLLAQHTLKNLDDQSLVRFNELSKELHQNATKERIVWIQIIKKYASRFKDVHEAWKEIVYKIPKISLFNSRVLQIQVKEV